MSDLIVMVTGKRRAVGSALSGSTFTSSSQSEGVTGKGVAVSSTEVSGLSTSLIATVPARPSGGAAAALPSPALVLSLWRWGVQRKPPVR
ncbi:MAG: hypothetical protein R3F11_10300 [Verrucomicrobiales bacterium]